MNQPAERKGQKKDQGCRGMGYVLLDPEKIGQVVDQRKKERKDQKPRLDTDGGRREGQEQKGSQSHLKTASQGDTFPEKKEKGQGKKPGE